MQVSVETALALHNLIKPNLEIQDLISCKQEKKIRTHFDESITLSHSTATPNP